MSKQGNMEFHPILVPDLKGGRQARKEMSLEELWHAQNNFLYKGWTWKYLKTKELNNLSYSSNFNYFYNTLMTQFEWETDEKQFVKRVVNMSLIDTAMVGAISGIGGKFTSPGKPTNIPTFFGDPKQWRWHGVGGCGDTGLATCIWPYEDYKNEERKKELEKADWKAVIMRDNDLCYPPIFFVMKYAYLLTDAERAFNTACKRLKSPRIVVADNNVLKGDLKDYKEAFEDNDEMFVQYKNALSNGQLPIQEIPSNTIQPTIVSELRDAVVFLTDQFFQKIGVDSNPNPDKSQYTSIDENQGNDQQTNLALKGRLDNRKDWCERLKAIDMNVSVKLSDTFIEAYEENKDELEKRKKEGRIYEQEN